MRDVKKLTRKELVFALETLQRQMYSRPDPDDRNLWKFGQWWKYKDEAAISLLENLDSTFCSMDLAPGRANDGRPVDGAGKNEPDRAGKGNPSSWAPFWAVLFDPNGKEQATRSHLISSYFGELNTICGIPVLGDGRKWFPFDEKSPGSICLACAEVKHEHICDNCRAYLFSFQLCKVKDLGMRLDPGGPMPSGECPYCGALCYERKVGP